MSTSAQLIELVHWRDQKKSGLAFSVILGAFFFIGFLGWSSLGCTCMLLAAHLAFRLAYYNTVGTKPKVPAEWLTEAQAQEHLSTVTEMVNVVARVAFSLTCCEDNTFTAQCTGGLIGVALACRLLGTTGFLFLLFLSAFCIPPFYEKKKEECDAALKWGRDKAVEVAKAAFAKVPSSIPIPAGKAEAALSSDDKKKL